MKVRCSVCLSKKRFECGFTLLEISAAIAILVVGILSILALYPVGLVTGKRAEDKFVASGYVQELLSELEIMNDSNPPFVASGTFKFQRKFHNDEYFYIYRTEDISGVAIPGETVLYPANMFYVRVAIYTSDRFAGGTETNPATPTGKAIKTFSTFMMKE